MPVAVYGVGEYRASEAAVTGIPRSGISSARRAAISIHGAQGSAAGEASDPTSSAWIDALAACGYPVHAGDYSASTYWYGLSGATGGYNWGNSDHVAAIGAGVTWIGSHGAKTDKVCLLGGSMGTLGAMNYYRANSTKVAAIVLVLPALDLGDMTTNDKSAYGSQTPVAASMYGLSLPQSTISVVNGALLGTGLELPSGGLGKVNVKTSNGWQEITFTTLSGNNLTGCSGGSGSMSSTSLASSGYGASITLAYGVTWPTLLSGAQLSANSPAVWAVTAGGLTVPTWMLTSDNDPVAMNTSVANTFAANVAAAGGGNIAPVVTSMGAIGHAVSATLNPMSLVGFFDANGGRA